jgi:hypothetical protein
MGLIREPRGVDFFVESRPLTEAEQQLISAYIRASKEKSLRRNIRDSKRATKIRRLLRPNKPNSNW